MVNYTLLLLQFKHKLEFLVANWSIGQTSVWQECHSDQKCCIEYSF